jgi:hypothetical protein
MDGSRTPELIRVLIVICLLVKQYQVFYQAGANVRVIHHGVQEPRKSSVPLFPVYSIRPARLSRRVEYLFVNMILTGHRVSA